MKLSLLYSEKKHCCGCGACAAICPADAIFMEEDEEGFDYPHIREERCVGCGQCVKVCPMHGKAGAGGRME